MNICIRRATEADCPTLSRILSRSWKSTYAGMVDQDYLDSITDDNWVDTFRQWMREGVASIILAEHQGAPLGCASYGAARQKEYEGWGELSTIYLLPEHIGKGVGKALMLYALDELRNTGYEQCLLHVLPENIRARNFYEAFGFEQAGELEVEHNGRRVINLVYINKHL